jgi:hypothetical protein
MTEKVHRKRNIWWHRFLLVFVGVPVVLAMMIFDALCAAWGELQTDLAGAKGAFMDAWRDE